MSMFPPKESPRTPSRVAFPCISACWAPAPQAYIHVYAGDLGGPRSRPPLPGTNSGRPPSRPNSQYNG